MLVDLNLQNAIETGLQDYLTRRKLYFHAGLTPGKPGVGDAFKTAVNSQFESDILLLLPEAQDEWCMISQIIVFRKHLDSLSAAQRKHYAFLLKGLACLIEPRCHRSVGDKVNGVSLGLLNWLNLTSINEKDTAEILALNWDMEIPHMYNQVPNQWILHDVSPN